MSLYNHELLITYRKVSNLRHTLCILNLALNDKKKKDKFILY